MADEMVLETQQWLNKTYGNVSGFNKVTENGKTGWPTIYALIRGLQHELGITELSDNFGEETAKRFDAQVVPKLKEGYKGNIVYLIQGAFWCKGIAPGGLDGVFSDYTQGAMTELQKDAGFPNGDGEFDSKWAKALFDMSAFILVPEGNKIIRGMQQWLNVNYNLYFGILPCDGVYQRSTNTALIYALQAEEGLSPDVANGNYGDTTTQLTPTLQEGDSGAFVEILQYGLFVNGFYQSGPFDGNYSAEVASEVNKFASFMSYDTSDYTSGVANLTIIKGLLTSNGNTNRNSNMLDTSTQLSDQDVLNFKQYGFDIIGRYLTGSVGTGSDKRDKYLTSEEIQRIVSSGMSIFPIYEDGGYEEDYFTGYQGYKDAFIAANAARKLGFPEGATIYFAVDVDLQEGDIDGTAGQYMIGVINGLSATKYNPGIYGTRNVCLHGEKLGMKYSFVSNMSYGWSGNLGYKMPDNWAFDQFVEYPIGGTPIDQGASSGKDKGHTTFVPSPENSITPEDALSSISTTNLLKGNISLDKSVVVIDEAYFKVTLSAATEFKKEGKGPSFNIKNGKFDSNGSASLKDFLKEEFNIPSVGADLIIEKLGETTISSEMTAGNMSFKISSSSGDKFTLSATYNIQKAKQKDLSEELSMTVSIEINPLTFVKEKVSGLAEDVVALLPSLVEAIVGAILAVGVCILLAAATPVEAVTALAAFIGSFILKIVTG
jgi:peptidoglycan hydrolase-like protein with peptidoglycan-binding domain